MKPTHVYVLIMFVFAILLQAFAVQAQLYEVNYNASSADTPIDPHFSVMTLKYEPYPVNAGDWFDVWVKVQNIGQNDAKNTRFELQPDYPFSSNDSLVRDYGIVPGTASAYKMDMQGDASEVILKYRVKAADNAPEGTSNLKFTAMPDSTNPQNSITVDLPIVIGETKTDFDVVMQDATSQGVSLAISNIGTNAATALTILIEPQDYVNITGASSSIIGNLDKGDFTTVTFQIAPNRNLHELKVQIAYTDTAGVRNTIEKTVPVNMGSSFNQLSTTATRSASTGISKYIYLIIGIVIGIFLVFVYRFYLRSKSKRKNG